MKVILLGAALASVAFGAASAQGSHAVRGYFRSDGTYVAPHYQTNPNNTRADNYSTQGNVNPYTGATGAQPLYQPLPTYRAYTPPAPRPTYTPYQPAQTYTPYTPYQPAQPY